MASSPGLRRLVREARTYLQDSELMAQFKEILGWDERRERYAAGAEDVWTRPTGVLDRPTRNQLNIRYGSYRKLPASVSGTVRINDTSVDLSVGGERRLLGQRRDVQVCVERRVGITTNIRERGFWVPCTQEECL